jgi:hypothetical protein
VSHASMEWATASTLLKEVRVNRVRGLRCASCCSWSVNCKMMYCSIVHFVGYCINIYIYIYTHTHAHTHVHTYYLPVSLHT